MVVIGHGFWQRRFGGDPNIIGQTIRIEAEPFTVIGIGPEGFTALGLVSEADVTIPLPALPLVTKSGPALTTRTSPWVSVGGRLREAVPLDQARAQTNRQGRIGVAR